MKQPAVPSNGCASMMPDAPMRLGRSSHLWQLDVLRGAAILMVFGYHVYGTVFGWDFVNNSFESRWIFPAGNGVVAKGLSALIFGQTGVMFFFVISGFCIHHSILQPARGMSSPGRKRFNYGAFMWRRGWRIYPAYLAVMIILIAAIRILPPHGIVTRHDFLLHVLMVHNLRAENLYTIDAVFWSLAVEWQFYLIYPAFLLLRNILPRRWGALGALGASLLVCIAARIFIAWNGLDDDASPSWQVWTKLPLLTWVNWCLGAAVAEYWNQGRRLFPIAEWGLAPLGLLVLGLNASGIYRHLDGNEVLWSIYFAVLLESYLHAERGAMRVEKLLIPVGLCSYSLYLVHLPIVGWLHPLALRCGIGGTSLGSVILFGAVGLGVSLAAAWMGFKLIELPGVKLGSRAWKKICDWRSGGAKIPAGGEQKAGTSAVVSKGIRHLS